MQTEATVFIVDDDPAARDSVAALVRSKGVPVDTYASAEEFLAAFDPQRVGCLVVDVRMTGMTGLDLQEVLRQRGSRLPIVVITGFGDVPTAVRAMRAGAFTFLEKPCRDQELWNCVQKALDAAGRMQVEDTRKAEVETRLAQLTPDELRVMREMVAGKPNKVIASELDIGLRTVELRRANVLKKMQADSLAELVRLALLVWQPPAT
jgi:FixJ family two-component response regulator